MRTVAGGKSPLALAALRLRQFQRKLRGVPSRRFARQGRPLWAAAKKVSGRSNPPIREIAHRRRGALRPAEGRSARSVRGRRDAADDALRISPGPVFQAIMEHAPGPRLRQGPCRQVTPSSNRSAESWGRRQHQGPAVGQNRPRHHARKRGADEVRPGPTTTGGREPRLRCSVR